MNEPAYMTTPQVAQALGKTVRTVQRMVIRNEIRPSHKLPGPNGALLFDPAEVARVAATPTPESRTA